MRLTHRRSNAGFTIGELMIVLVVSTLLLGATITTSASLQKSFAATDNFFGTQMQQIRIIDYLSRDVKRSTVVTTSADRATVTCTVPNYIIKAGDADAGAGAVDVGKRRTPAITQTANGAVVNYGTTNSTVVYALSNQMIQRTENGVLTTIASSTDSLIPETVDVEQANTEYAATTVTFLPTFNFNSNAAFGQSQAEQVRQNIKRNGTAVFAKAYLRNKRRG